MAVQFTTGTINQPDAGSVGLSMVERIRDDLVAHAAWDLVEEFTAGSGTCRWYVFKCLAAQSAMTADWYLIISRTLGSGELRFSICEDYNAPGHTMSFFSIGQNYTSTFNFDAQGRFAANTYTLGTTPFTTGAGSLPNYTTWTPQGTSTKWWLIIDNDGFTVAFNGASNGFVHCGAFIPLTQLAMTLPIMIMGYDSIGIICRNPAVANVSGMYGGALAFSGGQGSSPPNSNILGFASYMNYNDKLQNNQRSVAEIGMVTLQYQPQIGIPGGGYILGKHKRMRTGMQGSTPPGFAFGDAYVLNGKLWVPYLPTDSRVWDTGVAAS